MLDKKFRYETTQSRKGQKHGTEKLLFLRISNNYALLNPVLDTSLI